MRSADEKLREVRGLLADPFAAYPDLTEREQRAATLASRGASYKAMAKLLNVSEKTVYRTLVNAAVKIGRQEDREHFRWSDIVALVHERLTKAAGDG
jgi:DNA-binding CsgD family transcriptional regulator